MRPFNQCHRAAEWGPPLKGGGRRAWARASQLSPHVLDCPLSQHGETPLHWAAASGHKDVVAFLLERGALLEVANKVRRCDDE